MFKKREILLGLLVLAIAFLSGCDPNRVFEEYTPIPDQSWAADNSINYEFAVTDTLTPHNFYVNVRNTGAYRYSNLYVFFDIEFPNGKTSRDTIECPLADKTGRWLGSGTGQLKDNQFLIKYNMRFPLTGTYKFGIEQAMRVDPLEEISDVGLRLEKSI